MKNLHVLPCLDSDERAERHRQQLDISRSRAVSLGRTAVEAANAGTYTGPSGRSVAWAPLIRSARDRTVSIPPEAGLPTAPPRRFSQTIVQVSNETTLAAAWQLTRASGSGVLALNLANGLHPGGGFLHGARAQEEYLCRSSALYSTLVGDAMYEAHALRPLPDSTAWAIYSPDVPVFRGNDGTELEEPWLVSFVTCAAPVAYAVGQPLSGDLLQERIHRALSIAECYGHPTLVLGAWGCGAFGNDGRRTARDFRAALEMEFAGAFGEIVFAITDWSPERRFLGPFRDVFG